MTTRKTTLQELARGTGLSPATIAEVFAEVKANHARLDACPGPHTFTADDERLLKPTYTCGTCGGTYHGGLYWYLRGLRHGIEHPGQATAELVKHGSTR